MVEVINLADYAPQRLVSQARHAWKISQDAAKEPGNVVNDPPHQKFRISLDNLCRSDFNSFMSVLSDCAVLTSPCCTTATILFNSYAQAAEMLERKAADLPGRKDKAQAFFAVTRFDLAAAASFIPHAGFMDAAIDNLSRHFNMLLVDCNAGREAAAMLWQMREGGPGVLGQQHAGELWQAFMARKSHLCERWERQDTGRDRFRKQLAKGRIRAQKEAIPG